MEKLPRCDWDYAKNDPAYINYHDKEWGVPVHDDKKLFEMLVLESAQAGLSWITILRKRNSYIKAFAGFDPELVARFDSNKKMALMRDSGIIRNERKINSAILNAKCFLEIENELGSFDEYIWGFMPKRMQLRNSWEKTSQIPSSTGLSAKISHDLKRRSFRFIGSTIIYSYMQAIGMVNDHITTCFRYNEL